MKNDDLAWLEQKLDKSRWLFYGEFEEYLNNFLKDILSQSERLEYYGFNKDLPNDFQVAYWAVLSELCALGFVEYGISPRGAWLTNDGERFKTLIMNDVLIEYAEYIDNKYAG